MTDAPEVLRELTTFDEAARQLFVQEGHPAAGSTAAPLFTLEDVAYSTCGMEADNKVLRNSTTERKYEILNIRLDPLDPSDFVVPPNFKEVPFDKLNKYGR